METHIKTVEFKYPDMLSDAQSGASYMIRAWVKVPPALSCEEHDDLEVRIKRLSKERGAILIAYYCVDTDLQDLAEETGGCVSDLLEMARFGCGHSAKILIMASVRFVSETTKILSPERTMLMPDLDATRSLNLDCPLDELAIFYNTYPDRTVVVYANTGAAVKACVDWMVTSSISLKIVQHLHARGEKILWAPDRHLGSYVQKQIGADMLMWQGSYLVHDEFEDVELDLLRIEHPNTGILVYPGSSELVVTRANVVGSTSQPITAAQSLSTQESIVTTDNGILHKMRMAILGKRSIKAPAVGSTIICKSCTHCPWMAINVLTSLAEVLKTGRNEIHVDPAIGRQTAAYIGRMLDFAAHEKAAIRPRDDLAANTRLFQKIGLT